MYNHIPLSEFIDSAMVARARRGDLVSVGDQISTDVFTRVHNERCFEAAGAIGVTLATNSHSRGFLLIL